MATPAYCGGRFPVPPAFDFVLLPLKTKKVAVVSIIGSWDSLTCGSTSQLIENFLQKNVFSPPCGKSIIQGFYDCERQLIFLQFRDVEHLLDELLSNPKNSEDILADWDMERLKYLYYLFLVSHLILIVSYGTNLDPRYVALFKLLNRIRTKLRHSVETLLRTLPLPRYCIAAGRIATPRLLFLFKLPPTIAARRLAENEYALLALEKNLVNQIFNVFYDSGLLDGNSSETRLFDLMGYSYVRVLYPDVVEPLQKFADDSDRDSLAQELLEDLVSTVRPSALDNCDRRTAPPPLNPLYPPPDRPDDRSFGAFLQCHLSSLLDDANVRGSGDGHSHFTFELPSCKAWFIACYKLFTCLMSEPDAAVGRSPRTQTEAETSTGLSLAKSWQQLFSPATAAVSDHLGRSPTFAVQAMLEQKLSEIRSEAALTAAEAHYRQDLPAHYSRTYHLAKVISAYNVFLSHARGAAVLPALDHLTRRLARLYLAGQVGCSALSVSGVLCRQEMHRLPDRFPGITSAFQSLQHKDDGAGGGGGGGAAGGGGGIEEPDDGETAVVKPPSPHHSLVYYASRIASATEMDDVEAAARKACVGSSLYGRVPRYKEMLSESTMEIPSALTGLWRCQWVLTVLKSLVSAEIGKSEKTSTVPGEADAMASAGTQKPASHVTTGQGTVANAENPPAEEDQSTLHLAVMRHRSDLKFISSCNCGRQQAPRPDPFDYREANWEFYNSLALSCCSKLNSVALAPDFLNSPGHHFTTTTSADDASLTVDEAPTVSVNVTLAAADPAIVREETKNKKLEDGDLAFGDEGEEDGSGDLGEAFFNANDEFASENEASTSESSVAFEHPSSSLAGDRVDAEGLKTADEDPGDVESQDSETPFVTPRGGSHHPGRSDQSEGEEVEAEKEGQAAPQRLSHPRKIPVAFYDAMPTLGLPPGHLPLYASWAIHTLGKYFSYSHSSGFAYPGFLRGSNFLLPWDVQLSRTTNWQSTDRGGRGGRSKGRQRDFDTIKLFVGFEMECCLGHRFFLAGPQRAMVGLMQGCDVRRAVSSLLSRDLPIYMPCRCSKATPPENTAATGVGEAVAREVGGASTTEEGIVWAQLMRVYIALPAAPVRIRFQPRVRHGPLETQTPIFHLGPTLDEQMDVDQPRSSRTLMQEGGLPGERGENADDSLSDNSETPSRSAVRAPPAGRRSGPQAGYVYLDNGYLWVARLPFAYQSGGILYRRPKNPLLASECCLLGGSITLEEL